MMAADRQDATEIFRTNGKVSIYTKPELNLVQLYESGVFRRKVPTNCYGCFPSRRTNEFTPGCLLPEQHATTLEAEGGRDSRQNRLRLKGEVDPG